MSVEMIEAAWTDPVLRRELIEKGNCDIPDHPVGALKGFPDVSAGTAETVPTIPGICVDTQGAQCTYYFNSWTNCNATNVYSGGHCCQ
jgi:hypothetical protein